MRRAKTPRANGAVCVVGIGASAGGLEAINAFLRAMRADSGLAFVIVQHADPAQKSLATEIFSKRTAMPVTEAADGVKLEANRVYITPAGRQTTIENGVLHVAKLGDPRGRRLLIDHFFRSLGEDMKQRAIGVILSGSGSDGALGLRSIVTNGGVIFVQDPESAQFDGMPSSAIATGLVTQILAVEKMPEALLAYARHPYTTSRPLAAHTAENMALHSMLESLRALHGYNFAGYKHDLLVRRIHQRMRLLRIERLTDYAAMLRKDTEEVGLLYKDLLICVTEFFRDAAAWKVIKHEVITPLVEAKAEGEPIRAWVAGAATGEEAYSLAMILIEELGEKKKRCPVRVFATDSNEDALEFARAGIYPMGITAHVTPERLRRFFVEIKGEHQYQISRELRDHVVFGEHNLFADPPFSRMDLVTCRNLLIYLNPDVRRHVMSRLHFALKPGGHLFLGPAESTGMHSDLFRVVQRKWRIYQRSGVTPRDEIDWRWKLGEARAAPAVQAQRAPLRVTRLAGLVQRLLIDRFAPAAVAVNARNEILHFCGPTENYLAQPRGAPTQDLITLVGEGLRKHLRTALRRVAATGLGTSIKQVHMRRRGALVPVKITIVPVGAGEDAERVMLVVFEEQRTGGPLPRGAQARETQARDQLEDELRTTKDELQNSIERLETANEELHLSHEEVVSANEELQSMNEELESSKEEELQSLNEELSTVNQQLHNKVSELEIVNNDLRNLLSSSNVATLCLDRDLRIKWFTPGMRALLNVVPSDTGRRIDDLRSVLALESLARDATAMLETLQPVQNEVPDEKGRWFIRRVMPYRTDDERIDGVVVTFVDITGLKLAQEELRQREALLRMTLLGGSLGAWTQNLRTGKVDWDDALRGVLGLPADGTRGEVVLLSTTHPEDRERLMRARERAIAECGDLDIQHRIVRADGSTGWVLTRAKVVCDQAGAPLWLNGVCTDITPHVLLQQTSLRWQGLFDSAGFGLAQLDVSEKFIAANSAFLQKHGWSSEELVGKPLAILYPDELHKELHGHIQAAAESGNAVFESTHLRKDRMTFPVLVELTAIRDSKGKLASWVLYTRDISKRKRHEQELLESGSWIRAIIDNAVDGIITIDEQGTITTCNAAAERMFGYESAEMIGSNVKMLMPAPYHDEYDTYIEHYIRTGERKIIGIGREASGRCKDGTVFPLELSVSEIQHSGRKAYTGIVRDVSERKEAVEQLREINVTLDQRVRERTEQLQTMVAEVTAAEERERRAVAQDLHDGLAQMLSMVSVRLETLIKDGAGDGWREHLSDIRDLVSEANTSVRSLALQLSPPVLYQLGLIPALDWLGDEMQRLYGLKVTMNDDGEPKPLRQVERAILFRAVRELLVNIAKHARVSEAHIATERRDNHLTITVRDKGVGFQPETVLGGANRTLGLFSVHERLAFVGGSVDFISGNGEGTTVRLTAPLETRLEGDVKTR